MCLGFNGPEACKSGLSKVLSKVKGKHLHGFDIQLTATLVFFTVPRQVCSFCNHFRLPRKHSYRSCCRLWCWELTAYINRSCLKSGILFLLGPVNTHAGKVPCPRATTACHIRSRDWNLQSLYHTSSAAPNHAAMPASYCSGVEVDCLVSDVHFSTVSVSSVCISSSPDFSKSFSFVCCCLFVFVWGFLRGCFVFFGVFL